MAVLSAAFKAEPILLAADASAAEAFQVIAESCLRHFRRNEAPLVAAGDAEAVHQARVALRRLRSALSLFRAMLADSRFDHLRGEVRWISGLLGAVRGIDVMAERIDAAATLEQLADARRVACAVAIMSLKSRRFGALMRDLAEWIANGAWRTEPGDRDLLDRPAALFAAASLEGLRRRLKRRGANLADLHDEARHEARILAKRMRYASDFFEALFSGRKARRRRRDMQAALAELQESLGDLNDRADARRLLVDLGITVDPAMLAAAFGDESDAMLARAEQAYAAFVDSRPYWR